MVDDDVDIKIIPSDDETIIWLQMKSIIGLKISPEQFVMELEMWLHEVSKAESERPQICGRDH